MVSEAFLRSAKRRGRT